MKIILGFLPFFAFALASTLGHDLLGLAAGAVVALIMLLRDRFTGTRRMKLLELGTVVLFAGLAVFVGLSGVTLPVAGVRTCVDAGLALLVLASVLIGRPFTLDYAAPATDSPLSSNPRFQRTHRAVSLAWAAAFAVITAADAAWWAGWISPRHATLLIVASLFLAVRFSQRYPEQVRQRALAN